MPRLGLDEVVEELAGGSDRQGAGKLEEVAIAGDEDGPLLLGQRQETVVAGIHGAARRIGGSVPTSAPWVHPPVVTLR